MYPHTYTYIVYMSYIRMIHINRTFCELSHITPTKESCHTFFFLTSHLNESCHKSDCLIQLSDKIFVCVVEMRDTTLLRP